MLLAVVFGGLGCGKPPVVAPTSKAAWFEDVTEKVGLNFVHDAGPIGNYFFPQMAGSGCALLDYDNDGRLDIYFLQNAGPGSGKTNRLFHQEPDGRFKDVSAGSGLDIASYGMGVAVGDINNDGLPDVLVCEYGSVHLFLNKGHGKFADITVQAGLLNPQWAVSACFFDYDRDGWLDLVVVNYIDYDPANDCSDDAGKPDYCGPESFPPGNVTRLFHNLGASNQAATATPRFEDVTVNSGLGRVPGPGLGVVCADFDGDGWPDIFVANDGQPNRLWINQHDGTFKEEAVARGLAYNAVGRTQANMGVALGDTDGKGWFDLYVTHLTEEVNVLWRQSPRGMFQDQTAVAGLQSTGRQGTGFGTVFQDFDNNGSLDLAVVNGQVRRSRFARSDVRPDPALAPMLAPYAQRNQLFANDGSGKFHDVSDANELFCGTARISRGLVCGDIFNDGGIDLIVSSVASSARLYRNVAPQRGHWLVVRAIDPALGGRDAYGAEVTVQAGDRRWMRWLNPGYSYACSNDPRVHFGLGPAVRVDAITVLWPDGKRETFPPQRADQVLVLRKGDGR